MLIKKMAVFFVAMFALVASSFGSAVTGSSTTGNYDIALFAEYPADTIVAADSATIVNKSLVNGGYGYILVRGPITGNGSDSVSLQVIVDSYDKSGTFMYRATVDTMSTAAGENIDLEINKSVIGSRYTVKLKGITGNGGQVITPKIYVLARRIITWHKDVNAR